MEERIHIGIRGLVDRDLHRAAVDRRRRRDGHFRRDACVFLEKLEMLDHRMPGKVELTCDAHPFVARGDAGKGDAAFHDRAFDAVEAP